MNRAALTVSQGKRGPFDLAGRGVCDTRNPVLFRNETLSTRVVRLLLPLTLLAAAMVLDACGRRGPLELPLASTAATPQAPNIDSQSNGLKPGLSREVHLNDAADRDQVLAPQQPIVVPKTPFFLDPLL